MPEASGIVFGNQFITEDVFKTAFIEALRYNSYRENFRQAIENFWYKLISMEDSVDATAVITQWNELRKNFLFVSPTVTLVFSNDNKQKSMTQFKVPEGIFFNASASGVQEAGNEAMRYVTISKTNKVISQHWDDLLKSMRHNKPTHGEITAAIQKRKGSNDKRLERLEHLKRFAETNSGQLFTYYQDFFTPIHTNTILDSPQKRGQLFEVFANHMTSFHHILDISSNKYIKSTMFAEERGGFYEKLLSAFDNNRPWYVGGDITILGDEGIKANYQIKYTKESTVTYNTTVSKLRLMRALSKIEQALSNYNYETAATEVYHTFATKVFCEEVTRVSTEDAIKLVREQLQSYK